MATTLDLVEAHVRRALAARRGAPRYPLTVGLCGAQGCGKSTVAAALADRLGADGLIVAVLSLDDIYLPHEDRLALARTVHPLFRTRGVPGTHDVALGEAVLDQLARGPTAIPRFDKARDTRAPASDWPLTTGAADVILFEGWCVGARPEPEAALADPVNELERAEDPDGVWRRYAHGALAGPYQRLFARIDTLVLLAAPDFDVVAGWRQQQEHALRSSLSPEFAGSVMGDAAVARFVSHYERLTRHILDEMPPRAALTVRLDPWRRPV